MVFMTSWRLELVVVRLYCMKLESLLLYMLRNGTCGGLRQGSIASGIVPPADLAGIFQVMRARVIRIEIKRSWDGKLDFAAKDRLVGRFRRGV